MFSLHNDNDDDDHGISWADAARALAGWWRLGLGASHEATDMFHQPMCLVPYQPGSMVVAFTINFITFFSS